MGTSVPPEPRWAADASPAEQQLWRWAVEQLPERVLILPQVMMSVGSGGRLEEAEADLVLIDPEHGVTVIEVKGGTISYDATRAIWRRREGGAKEFRDPVQQVKRTRGIVTTTLANARVEVNAIAIRWGVAAPDCNVEAPGEPVLHASQLWDATAASSLAEQYAKLVGSLSSGEQPLGQDRADFIARHLRGRSTEGRPALSTAVDAHEELVRVHTESHRNVLRQFAAHQHVLVRGAAGTGKTVLAIEAAAQAASWGKRVLLTCWNVVLAEWLRESLRAELHRLGSPAADDVTSDPAGKVVVAHVAGLARGTEGRPRMAAEDKATTATWFHEELPLLLNPATTNGEFEAVILDEAQDLSENWVLAVSCLVAKGGHWFAFSDRQQDLFDAHAALPEFLEVQHELRENFRNTRAIAEFAGWFGDIEMDCVTGDGPPVRFVAVPHDRVEARTQEIAKKLARHERIADRDLAVLWLFHNPYRGRTDELAVEAMRGELVRTNAASFKGMERPVVVLGLDIDPGKTDRADEVRRSIYAGATRARSSLTVVGDPDVVEAYGFKEGGRALRDT